MKIKHKVIKEFQYLSPEKKIFILKTGTILEEYNYKVKSEIIQIDKDIIDNNPEFFEIIDWKAELLTYIKTNKLPTPSVLTKKLIPFIEEIVLSSIQQTTGKVVDDSVVKELERKEIDLNSREKRIKDKEDEIDIRIKRVEKREGEYKEDLKLLDKKEDDLREKSKDIIEKELYLDDKIQDLNEKERNLDRNVLESSKEIDEKYVKLQKKIDKDLKELSERERNLEVKSKELSEREVKMNDSETGAGILSDKIQIFNEALEDINKNISFIDSEISALNEFTSSKVFDSVNGSKYTMQYLVSIENELLKKSNDIKEIFKRIN